MAMLMQRRGVMAKPTFAPSDLSGLIGWWKADALALSNGAAVTAWADSSTAGHNLAQAGGTLQPVYNTSQQNGLPAVTFDGTNDYLATSAFVSPTAGASILAVLKVTLADAYKTLLNHPAAATWTAPYSRVLARVGDNTLINEWQFVVEDATVGANSLTDQAQATTTWQLMEFVYDAATLAIRRNGTDLVSTPRTGTLTSSIQPMFLGADTGGGTVWKGQIGEVLYYSRGLTSGELAQVRSYMATRWGL